MAKNRPRPSKGLRSIGAVSAAPNAEGWLDHASILDQEAPNGTYEVDVIVIDMHGNGRVLRDTDLDDLVRHARAIVDTAGQRAAHQAQQELATGTALKSAALTFKNLDKLRHAALSLRQAKPDQIGPLIARPDDIDDHDDLRKAKKSAEYAVTAVEELFRKAVAVGQEVEEFLARYKLPKGQGSSVEPLTNWYMFYCASCWHSLTGEWAKRDNSADLRRFLTAGWIDLHLPTPTGRDGLPKPPEDHFRDRLAKSDVFDLFRGN